MQLNFMSWEQNNWTLIRIHHIFLFLFTDRVFRGDCSTRQVYEEGAKEIALSVVSGINGEYKY